MRRSLPDEHDIQSRLERRPHGAEPLADGEGRVRIYFLPNLLTAGNLACGFFALTWIFKYQQGEDFEPINTAIRLILAAFAFDLFDGRLARLAHKESRFGREFDSLADIVSFGVAPAFLIYRIVLQEFDLGWVIAAIYLVCGGIRLARFNVLSTRPGSSDGREFVGFPIPSAAALVVSVTMLIMWMVGHERTLGNLRFVLPVLMLLLSGLMVSNVHYPTFKYIDWTRARSVAAFATVVIVGLLLAKYFQITLALLFIAYLLYGLARPWVSKRWQREIESDEEDEDDSVEG
ncbi:MAG: CDP-diacylglycerol--serine O-phosphatidyltransferase [Verrucomicrobiia bacterium]